MSFCKIHQLGEVSYAEVWNLQKMLFEELISQKRKGEFKNHHLIFVEHPHVYTFGKHAHKNHLLASPDMLKTLGAEVFEIERGGDITYHGPGQWVVYPLFDLESLGIGIKTYVKKLEECIIEVIGAYGIKGEIIEDRIGVWIDVGSKNERKIAAIGIKSSRYVTMHGLALNINTDLEMFRQIIPCGIPDKEVTSLSRELNENFNMMEVMERLKVAFSSIFGVEYI
jgi:lipoyl(octanoyl) transferase